MLIEGKWIRDPQHKRNDLKSLGFHKTGLGWSDSKREQSAGEKSALRLNETLNRMLPDNEYQVIPQKKISAYNVPADKRLAAEIHQMVERLSFDEMLKVGKISRRMLRMDMMVKPLKGIPPFPFYIEIDGIQHQGNSPKRFEPPEDKASQTHSDRVKDCCSRLNHDSVVLRVNSTAFSRKKLAAAIMHATRYYEALQETISDPDEKRAEVQRFCDAACFHFASDGNLKDPLGRGRRSADAYRRFADNMRDSIIKRLTGEVKEDLNAEEDKLIGIWARNKELLHELLVTIKGRGDDKARIGFVKKKRQKYYDTYRFCSEIETEFVNRRKHQMHLE